MKSTRWGISVLCLFFILTLFAGFFYNRHFPVLAVGSESSMGTWLSGVLLAISAAAALITGMRSAEYRWWIVAVFFFLLGADERFMFHERMKEYIIFTYSASSVWIYELPVLVGALAGALVSWMLWQQLEGMSKVLLAGAVLLGLASVALDVLGKNVLIEESLKLLAELLIACSLVSRSASI